MTGPVCPNCGNDGSEGSLYLTVDARWDEKKKVWVIEERQDTPNGLDCLACDEVTSVYAEDAPDFCFPYQLEVAPVSRDDTPGGFTYRAVRTYPVPCVRLYDKGGLHTFLTFTPEGQVIDPPDDLSQDDVAKAWACWQEADHATVS